MTLQEILPAVRQLPPAEKIELRRLLDAEAQASQDITSFSPGATYHFFTPYECAGLERLAQELSEYEARDTR